MSKAIYSTASGMMLEQRRQETIAKNLAASNIPGFKREFVASESFGRLLQDKLEGQNLGTDKGQVAVDFSQGGLKQTGRTLDFAIQGEGFFEVTTPDHRKLYTRNGSFFVSKNNELITSEGFPVSGDGGNISFATSDNITDICATADGKIRVRQGVAANYVMTDKGLLKIVGIKDPSKFKRISANYFTLDKENERSVQTLNTDKYIVVNNYLEASNSEPIRDMVSMIECQREFEMGQKVLKMLNERFSQEVRRLAN